MTPRILVPVLLLAAACSTVTVTIPVMKPAEINVAHYQQIGVDHLQNDRNDEVTSLLKTALVESGRFKVLDRENLGKITNEQRLAASGAATGDNVQLGQQLVASALVLGSVTHSGYQENMERYEFDLKDLKGYVTHHVRYTRRGSANVRVMFQVTDVTTGQVIKAKAIQYQTQDSTSATDEYPANLNRDAMLEAARKRVVSAFVMAITPHTIQMDVDFKKDSKLPQLEDAINLVKAAQYDDAEKMVSDAIELGEKGGLPAKVLAKAYWDRGLIYEYSDKFEPAKADVKKAYEYARDEDYIAELSRISVRQADEAKLKAQGVAPDGQQTPETAQKGDM